MRIAIITKQTRFVISLSLILIPLLILSCKKLSLCDKPRVFDGQQAYKDVKYQMELGPRIPGSEAHGKAVNWMVSELENSGWNVEMQEAAISGINIKNIIAKRGTGKPWVIIGSHYDSRPFADKDLSPEGRKQPVPGANDGASSVAILLELARSIPENLDKHIWLVFFDAEDISGDELAVGSQYFVDNLSGKPDSVVVLDMVGDKDLNINMEWNSNPELNQEIWEVASELGYTQFIPAYKYAILDDHIPFINVGIRAVDVIDFDYPYWHTTQDTLDKVSADSLKAVGDTILKWIDAYPKDN
jgi:glutaminyl-peptide cyclotransferase